MFNFSRKGRMTPTETDRLKEAMKAAETNQAPQAPPSSIVGGVVTTLDRVLQQFRNQETILIAERDAKIEALRQTQAVIKSMELALTEVCDDPALTDEQRAAAAEPMHRLEAKFAEAVDADTLKVAHDG